MYLVGNKTDLADKRQVSAEEANNFAEHWDIPFFETSVYDDQGVSDLFFTFVVDMYHLITEGTGGSRKKERCTVS